ncbi:MAG: tol-pal system-associated acyl-CoA thioesterase [Pseudomonadota bacterium]
MHETAVRVYYEDTDFGGVVYYANYLKFIERGRTELLRNHGIDQVALKAAGLVFVVRRLAAEYLSPARFDDLLVVETRITEARHASVAMAQRVLRGGTPLFTAEVLIATMDATGRPARLPPEIRAKFVEGVQSS